MRWYQMAERAHMYECTWCSGAVCTFDDMTMHHHVVSVFSDENPLSRAR